MRHIHLTVLMTSTPSNGRVTRRSGSRIGHESVKTDARRDRLGARGVAASPPTAELQQVQIALLGVYWPNAGDQLASLIILACFLVATGALGCRGAYV
jgi:hypothetical protein